MKRALTSILLFLSLMGIALAQGTPNLQNGQVPTAAQWNSYFAAKQNTLGYSPVNKAGDVMTGELVMFPSSTLQASINVPPGVAPTSPANGDIWETTAGIFARVNGTTVGPLSGPSGGSFAGTSPITVSFPSSVVTYAFNFAVANTWLAQQTNQGATTTSPGWYTQIPGDTVPRMRVGLNATDIASVAFGPGNANRDTFIERNGIGTLRLGTVDAAAPVAQIVGVQNVVAGTSNTAGANFTINGSQGTGTGVGGSIIFQVAPAGSTGSTQNALATVLTLDSTKKATFTGAVSAAGHVTFEGVTSTGATGTGLLVFGSNPSIATLTVTGAFTATGLVTNADLVNASTTVNTVSCTLGSSCTVTAAAGTLTGTTLNATVITSSLTSVGALGAGSATTGFTIASSSVTWTGTIPAANQAATNLATSGNGGVTGLLPFTNLATVSADFVVGNFTGSTASPGSAAIGNCANALTYSTTTHAFGCNATAGTGTVTSVTLAGAGGIVISGTNPITSSGTFTATFTPSSAATVSVVKTRSWCPSGCTVTVAGGGTATYSSPTGLQYVRFVCVAAGGGGGGVVGGGTNFLNAAGSGGAGSAGDKTLSSAAANGLTISIGAGGSAGLGSPSNGGAGGDTSVGTLCIGKGGGGGLANNAGTGGGAGAGGAASTGDYPTTGAPGAGETYGAASTFNAAIGSGAGGSTMFGGGGTGIITSNSATGGLNATGCGGGGSGAAAANTSLNAAGGGGFTGCLVAYEFANQ